MCEKSKGWSFSVHYLVLFGVVVMQVLMYVRVENALFRLEKLEEKMIILWDTNSEDGTHVTRTHVTGTHVTGTHVSGTLVTGRHVTQRKRRAVRADTGDNRRYSSFQADSTGFRLYNAWVSNSSLAQDEEHHSSTDTGSSAHNSFLKFGDSMYSDGLGTRIHDRAAASRVPVSKTKLSTAALQSSNSQFKERKKFKRKHPKKIRLNWKKRRQDRKNKKKFFENPRSKPLKAPVYNVSDMSVNRSKLKSRGLAILRGKLLPAIHLHGVGAKEGMQRKISNDFTVRSWAVARWARRIRMDTKFLLNDGKLTVMSPGIYFVYAQINYLDSNDANAFQIVVNESPLFLCTTMTHKRKYSTKSNTCYTGGIAFLEQGDVLYIKDLEQHRSAVMQSTHSFFGLAQLSGV